MGESQILDADENLFIANEIDAHMSRCDGL